jgi:hypothetical protein
VRWHFRGTPGFVELDLIELKSLLDHPVDQPSATLPDPASLRCPFCGHVGIFVGVVSRGHDGSGVVTDLRTQVGPDQSSQSDFVNLGWRRCPNPKCHRLIVVATELFDGDVVASYPPERLDFDSTGLPPAVEGNLDEAVRCHAADCHNAAAVMLRRTVESICDDLGVAKGDLTGRIPQLHKKISINPAVLDGLHKIRIFGNQGGHSGVARYERVDAETVEVAVAVVKRIAQTAYQDQDVVERLGTYLDAQPESGSPTDLSQ